MRRTSYPVVLTDLAGARCLVVGGGAVAERKVRGLLDAGARPVIVSPRLAPALAALHAAGRVDHHARAFAEDDVSGAVIVFAATDDPVVNAAVAASARVRGILVNVADQPELGSFHTTGTVRRDDLLLAVSTGGTSPALAGRLRAELAEGYGPEYGQALRFAAAVRTLPPEALPPDLRAELVRWLCSEQALGWLREGCDDLVATRVQRAIDRFAAQAGVAR